MEEEKILIINEENNYDAVIVENTDEIIYDETIQIIELDKPEVFAIDTDEAFVSSGGQNEHLNHKFLHNRDAADQHTIGSITGLREELDGIHALKTVESDKNGCANYYEWKTPYIGSIAERVGYFVSIHTENHKISICDDKTEIFGVTVDSAGFVGGQDENDKSLDATYALVANTGVVKVRCLPSVWAGSYVMSNNRGEAVSSGEYGYYVISIIDDRNDGQRYAVISLDSTMNQVYQLSEDVSSFRTKLADVERNANSAINAANKALQGLSSNVNSALQNSQDALNNSNSALDKVTDFENSFTGEITGIKTQVDAINDEMVTAIQTKTQEIVGEMVNDAVSANKEIEEIQRRLSDTRNDLNASLDEVRRLSEDEAMLSKYLSNDYKTIDTWSELRKDTSQIYYVKDEGLYYYYDVQTDSWLNTPEPSEAGLSEVIASIRQKADKDEAMVENLTAYSDKKYETVEVWDRYEVIFGWENKKYIADPYIIYYDEETQLYWQCDLNNTETPWSSSSVAPSGFKALNEDDIGNVYYAEDTKRYYYYDNGWHSSNSSVASLVQSIALTRQIANENKAEIANILGYSGEDGFSLSSIIESVEDNKAEIELLTSYVQKNYIELKQPWSEVSDGDKTPGNVYYAKDTDDTWKYWYYKEDNTPPWVDSVNPADAGLVASIANINQKATDNEASISLLTDFQDEISKRVASLEVGSDGIETMVVNINKYSLGKYSQAYGLSVGEAAELLVDGAVFVPYENIDTPEVYDRITELDEEWAEEGKCKGAIYHLMYSGLGVIYLVWDGAAWTPVYVLNADMPHTFETSFMEGYYYTWNKTTGIWDVSEYGGVRFPTEYTRGDETTKFIVIKENVYNGTYETIARRDSSLAKNKTLYYTEREKQFYYYDEDYPDKWVLAQNPDLEVDTLYYWDTDKLGYSYWKKVATLNDNTLGRAMSQVRQKANSIEMSVTDIDDNLAEINTTVNQFKSSIESVTEFDGRLTTIEQKSDKDEARINMLVAHGLEETDVHPNEMSEPNTSKVYYYENGDNKLYYYWNGEGWSQTTDIEDPNVAKRIRSAGIITAINDDLSNVKISGDKISITADDINLEGVVTFEDLSQSGKSTVIKGDYITTGVIKSKNYGSIIDSWSVESGDTDYSFDLVDGYYESNNKGVRNSVAMCKINFHVTTTSDIKFDACSYAEYNDTGGYAVDYGMFGKLNIDIDSGSTYKNDNIHYHFRNNNSSDDTTIIYPNVEPGDYHIWVLFKKDGTTNEYNDCMRFKFSDDMGLHGMKINLDDGSITTRDFNVDANGNVTINGVITANDLATEGNTIVHGANITTGTVTADKLDVGAITAETINVGWQSGNCATNWTNTDGVNLDTYFEISQNSSSPYYDKIRLKTAYTDTTTIRCSTKPFYASSGDTFKYGGILYNRAANLTGLYIEYADKSNSESWSWKDCKQHSGTGTVTVNGSYTLKQSGWYRLTYALDNQTAGCYCKDVYCYRSVDGNLIVDGTITTDKIKFNLSRDITQVTDKNGTMSGKVEFIMTTPTSSDIRFDDLADGILSHSIAKSMNDGMPNIFMSIKNLKSTLDGLQLLPSDLYINAYGIHVKDNSQYSEITGQYIYTTGITYSKGVAISSTESVKTNITLASSMLSKIRKADIYNYDYLSDIKENNNKNKLTQDKQSPHRYGLVIGDGYNTPSEVISADGEHIDLYSMASLGWKGIKELADLVDTLTERIEALENKQN